MARNTNYSSDRDSEENVNYSDKYAPTGESEFSRESTVPYDQDEVLSERHYTFSPMESHGRSRIRSREPKSEPTNFRGVGPKNYVRTDEMIKEDANLALYRHWDVDATDIEVSVRESVITLKGFVKTKEQKRAAEAAVENIRGVKDVYNEIHLRKPENPKPSRFGLTDNITGLN